MSVILQVGSVEHVLGRLAALGDVLGEVFLSVDDVLAPSDAIADIVERHEWVVFSVGMSALVARVWIH